MENGIPGGIVGLLFLWGLWEWSRKAKKDKSDNDDMTGVPFEEKPNTTGRNIRIILGLIILVMVIIYIIILI
ncbi:MAG TPA: hypothetical protein VLH15_05730 [Dehalococcoidales bacterium]|nr:hypothetical protein [Dehalococcoidales bacterium]